eukprot:5190265-Alexandrium_andersonii.AAC.1
MGLTAASLRSVCRDLFQDARLGSPVSSQAGPSEQVRCIEVHRSALTLSKNESSRAVVERGGSHASGP